MYFLLNMGRGYSIAMLVYQRVGGGLKQFLYLYILGEMIQFKQYFFDWVETTN